MLNVILLILSLVIVYFSFQLSVGNGMNRLIIGIVLILSIECRMDVWTHLG
ncbi:hypothetical protein SAMN04487786_1232 [Paenisporosarcina quisquiliarum]|nr:hypothetical protein SAMN04487786_1232 [Paenisporosarcina quisquiliarum]